MAALSFSDVSFVITNEDVITSNGLGPASPGSARSRLQISATRQLRRFRGTITLASGANTYTAGGFPFSGVLGITDTGAGPFGGTRTFATVAGNGLSVSGLGCPNELVDLQIQGEDEATSHLAAFVPGVAGTTPHRIKLFQDNAIAGAKPLTEVAGGTASNDATVFPGAPTVFNVVAFGY